MLQINAGGGVDTYDRPSLCLDIPAWLNASDLLVHFSSTISDSEMAERQTCTRDRSEHSPSSGPHPRIKLSYCSLEENHSQGQHLSGTFRG